MRAEQRGTKKIVFDYAIAVHCSTKPLPYRRSMKNARGQWGGRFVISLSFVLRTARVQRVFLACS
jgi:hypothetical protein